MFKMCIKKKKHAYNMEYTFKKQQSKNYTFLNLPKTNCIVKIYKLMDLCTNLTWMSVVQGLVQDFVVVSQLVSSFSRCTSASPLSNTFACTFSPFHPGQPLWHLFLFCVFVFLQIFCLPYRVSISL